MGTKSTFPTWSSLKSIFTTGNTQFAAGVAQAYIKQHTLESYFLISNVGLTGYQTDLY